jgi:MoxR-like ATPase
MKGKNSPSPEEWAAIEARVNAAEGPRRRAAKAGSEAYREIEKAYRNTKVGTATARLKLDGSELEKAARRPRVVRDAIGVERREREKAEDLMGEAGSLERSLAGFRMQNLVRALREDYKLKAREQKLKNEESEILLKVGDELTKSELDALEGINKRRAEIRTKYEKSGKRSPRGDYQFEIEEQKLIEETAKLLGRVGAELTGSELGALAGIRRDLAEISAEREKLLESSPEAYFGLHLRELKHYKEDLAKGRIVETPYVKEQAEDIVAHLKANKPVLIYGHLGSGKTELAMHIARKYIGKDALVVSGSKYTSLAELYGHQILTVDERTGSTITDYFLGPVYRAMEEGRPVIIDEVNAIPHEVLISLNHILTREVGDVVSVQQNSGKQIKIKEGFCILMTGNMNQGQKIYVDRQDMDPAFLSRLYRKEYDYLPQTTEGSLEDEAGNNNELFHLLLSRVMDRNGNLQAPPDTMRKLWKLSKAARITQDIFAGREVKSAYYFREGAGRGVKYLLKESVLSLRALGDVISQWQKEEYSRELDYYLWREFVSQSTVPADRAYLYQLLKDQFGFFKSDGWEQNPNYGKGGNVHTFDIKAPKNAAGDLEFAGPREVIVAGFGKPPERAKWPEIESSNRREEQEKLQEELSQLGIFKERIEKAIEELTANSERLCEITGS